MNNYPTVADMLTVIGVALLITVVLTALLGAATNLIPRRRKPTTATVHALPTQRTPETETHAHAA